MRASRTRTATILLVGRQPPCRPHTCPKAMARSAALAMVAVLALALGVADVSAAAKFKVRRAARWRHIIELAYAPLPLPSCPRQAPRGVRGEHW